MRYLRYISLFIFLSSCIFRKDANFGYKNITPEEAMAMISASEDVILLDVRTRAEFDGELGHIEGAINIPVQELERRLGEIEKYRGRKIIVYCRSGNRSRRASRILVEHGFKNVYNMVGGILRWNKILELKAK